MVLMFGALPWLCCAGDAVLVQTDLRWAVPSFSGRAGAESRLQIGIKSKTKQKKVKPHYKNSLHGSTLLIYHT